jgi:hypothetical protein
LSEQSASDFVALAIRSRAEVIGKKLFRTACVGDPFLSWSENRTAVLTILCADAETSAPTEEQG